MSWRKQQDTTIAWWCPKTEAFHLVLLNRATAMSMGFFILCVLSQEQIWQPFSLFARTCNIHAFFHAVNWKHIWLLAPGRWLVFWSGKMFRYDFYVIVVGRCCNCFAGSVHKSVVDNKKNFVTYQNRTGVNVWTIGSSIVVSSFVLKMTWRSADYNGSGFRNPKAPSAQNQAGNVPTIRLTDQEIGCCPQIPDKIIDCTG